MISEDFIWQPFEKYSVDEILMFEKQYHELIDKTPLDFTENGFEPHDFGEGGLVWLSRARFDLLTKADDEIKARFLSCGCSEREILVIRSFLDFASGMYRTDSYHRIPPFVAALCCILDSGLRKLPSYEGDYLTRACNDNDRIDFCKGDIFRPGFALTTSADHSWRDKKANRYFITPLESSSTKARSIYKVYNKADEYQVTFTSDAAFIVEDEIEWNDNYKEIYLREIND